MDHQLFSTVHHLQRDLAALLLYQGICKTEMGHAFCHLLNQLAIASRSAGGIASPDQAQICSCLEAYGAWFRAIAQARQGWSSYVLSYVLTDANSFTLQAQQQQSLHPALRSAAQHDLRILHQLYKCSGEQVSQWVKAATGLEAPPVSWHDDPAETSQALLIHNHLAVSSDWGTELDALVSHYREFGTGLFATYRAFRWHQGALVGIAYPDPIYLNNLVGYEAQKQTLIQNTEALLKGYPALHVLLYGSRGSGKSSVVKALLSEYGDRGLRIVEVAKSELQQLPTIVDQLRGVPQKFIVFVDDLSFEDDDDAYKALKVVLEGNLTARPQNVVVYATSNRRHLIREFFGDRPRPSDADEISTWDTLQEKLSFSDRFGLTLTFEPADQTTYLDIVRHLAAQANLAIAPADLDYRALQWATRHNGRSGRSARQFVDVLQAEAGLATRPNDPTSPLPKV